MAADVVALPLEDIRVPIVVVSLALVGGPGVVTNAEATATAAREDEYGAAAAECSCSSFGGYFWYPFY